jgi:hypothetical protein
MSVADEFASEDEFMEIEAAVLETPRGRRFLAEHARRCRMAETQTLLEAMMRIENALTLRPAVEPGETGLLAAAIKTTSADIAAIRNHMLADGGAIPEDAAVFERIAEETRKLANEIMAHAEHSQAEPDADGDGADFWTLAWRLDVLSQRVTKAMALLVHIDSRVATMAPDEVAGIPELAQKLAPENLKFFEDEEELFAPEPAAPAPAPVKAEKPSENVRERIVIIRRSTAPPPVPEIVSDNVA